jgi:hypothetical protein
MAIANKTLTVTSGGLTTASTAYSANDQVGTIFTFTNFGTGSGLGGILMSVRLDDETDIIGQYSVVVYSASVTPAADNAAFAVSDADSQLQVGPGPIWLGPVSDNGANRTAGWTGSIPYNCAATSLFALLRTDGSHTFFGATTSLKLTLSALTV